ncbi:MAG: hypothetical protein ACKPCM_14280 [Pseudanabaena sp.]
MTKPLIATKRDIADRLKHHLKISDRLKPNKRYQTRHSRSPKTSSQNLCKLKR